MKYGLWIPLFLALNTSLSSQKAFEVACVAFYNFENLFDTLDSPDTDDFEFTPAGPNLYNSKVYSEKLSNLSRVVSELGTGITPDGAAVIGVSEIENRSVLEDFITQPAIAKHKYQIIHRDSKDGRGVDVALLYQEKYFKPDTVLYHPLVTSNPGEPVRYSRDILITVGQLNGERVAISVNHWPSRRGGEQTTAHLRNKAAAVNRQLLDSLYNAGAIVKSIVMGDLNDDPVNDSVHKFLKAGRSVEKLDVDEMYNPMEEYYRKGLGTTAYQDAWSLFDQIILSEKYVTDKTGYHFHKAVIHNPPYLTQKTGKYKGYPLRAYSNGQFTGGYSDHFPVYVVLVKEKT